MEGFAPLTLLVPADVADEYGADPITIDDPSQLWMLNAVLSIAMAPPDPAADLVRLRRRADNERWETQRRALYRVDAERLDLATLDERWTVFDLTGLYGEDDEPADDVDAHAIARVRAYYAELDAKHAAEYEEAEHALQV